MRLLNETILSSYDRQFNLNKKFYILHLKKYLINKLVGCWKI